MAAAGVALVVADADAAAALVAIVRGDPRLAGLEVLAGDGGDDTVDLAVERRPRVVIATASLDGGDGRALLAAVRELAGPPAGAPAAWLILVGDDEAGQGVADRVVPSSQLGTSLVEAILEGLRGEEPDRVALDDDAAPRDTQEMDAVVLPPGLRELALAADTPGSPREDTLILPSRGAGGGARMFDMGDDLDAPPVELDAATLEPVPEPEPEAAAEPDPEPESGGEFARNLRRKMSEMAQRLFKGPDAASPPPASLRPRHDHHTEIDLGAFGDGRGHTELEEPRSELGERVSTQTGARTGSSVGGTGRSLGTEPPAVDGEPVPLVRGERDVPRLLARALAVQFTGELEVESDGVTRRIVLEQGRPVFAASSAEADRLGQLLVREGKLTAAQLRRGLEEVGASGRRTGEVLVDLGFLKRRELASAVRRHLEDIVYATFGARGGTCRWRAGDGAPAERLRLSRQPAALILEGIRRKFDDAELATLIGPPPLRVEIIDRDRLAALTATADLSTEERAAIGALDGSRDLAAAARIAGLDDGSAAALAWGLIVLGVAASRRPADRTGTDEGEVLVGETDLAIDRERVHGRHALVLDADYFTLLGVRRDARPFEIRRAYEAARRDYAAESFAPELRRELAAELDEIAAVLDEAFGVLKGEPLRTRYAEHLLEPAATEPGVAAEPA